MVFVVFFSSYVFSFLHSYLIFIGFQLVVFIYFVQIMHMLMLSILTYKI